jgi:hypothetical protein
MAGPIVVLHRCPRVMRSPVRFGLSAEAVAIFLEPELMAGGWVSAHSDRPAPIEDSRASAVQSARKLARPGRAWLLASRRRRWSGLNADISWSRAGWWRHSSVCRCWLLVTGREMVRFTFGRWVAIAVARRWRSAFGARRWVLADLDLTLLVTDCRPSDGGLAPNGLLRPSIIAGGA